MDALGSGDGRDHVELRKRAARGGTASGGGRVTSRLGTASRVLVLALGVGLGGMAPARAWAADAASAADQKAEAPKTEEDVKLEQASKLIEQLNYNDARQVLFGIVESGRANADQLSKAYFSLGEVEAGLGNTVESTDSFYLALMLKPATGFPAGGSPKIRERLNEARSRVTEVGVLEATATVHQGVLEVQLENDPLQLVKTVDVVMTRGGGEVGKAKLPLNAMRAEVDPGVQSIRVTLHDESGNELKSIDVDPATQNTGAGQPAENVGKPSLWSHWGVWAGMAGAFAVGGTYFIVKAGKLNDEAEQNKKSDTPSPSRIHELQTRRDRVGTYGVVGVGMAGAAAVTAVVVALTHPGEAAPKKDAGAGEAHLDPTFGPGLLGANFHFQF
jgi:hypothetical protein